MSPGDGAATSLGPDTKKVGSQLSGASWIPVIQPHLSPVLVGLEQLDWVRSIARSLPSDALHALEFRLGPQSSQVDLAVRFQRPSSINSLIACMPESPGTRYFSRWALRPAREDLSVPELWLEFDSDRPPANTALPEPVFCLRLAGKPDPA